MPCRCYWISGRVQGVNFRASTQHQARQLGLTGHALNLRDGRVEVLACGTLEALAQLEVWLRQGPPGARVDEVESGDMPADPGVSDFRTGSR